MANPIRWWQRRGTPSKNGSTGVATEQRDLTVPADLGSGNFLQQAVAEKRLREQKLAAKQFENDVGVISAALLYLFKSRLSDAPEWLPVQRAIEALRATSRDEYSELTRDQLRRWPTTDWKQEIAWNFALVIYERPLLVVGGALAVMSCVVSALQALLHSWSS